MENQSREDVPLYRTFSELFGKGFSLDWGTIVFLVGVHTAAIALFVWLFFAASSEWARYAAIWAIVHCLLGSFSTTVYSHRLITHNAAKSVSAPVHAFFCFFGQIFSVQGSVRYWAANHTLHHGVDRSGNRAVDPYSATWFADPLRNFLWSHTLAHCFFHPQTKEVVKAHAAKRHPIIMTQEKWYGLLTTFWIFLMPMALGFMIGGWPGFFALLAGSMIGTVAIQHNTWTVNSITHMWGWTKGLSSSAKNNYVWLGPVGEGNHHGDHHDFPRDYRNGFGWTGWLLDPSRYLILMMRALGLLGELNKASAKEEAAVLGARRMDAILLPNKDQLSADAQALFVQLEEKVLQLRKDWVDAIGKWESLKKQNRFVRKASLSRQEISEEIRQAKVHVNAKKEEFFSALDSLRRQALALA